MSGTTAEIGYCATTARLLDPGDEVAQAPEQCTIERLARELPTDLVGVTLCDTVVTLADPVIHAVTVAVGNGSTIRLRVCLSRRVGSAYGDWWLDKTTPPDH